MAQSNKPIHKYAMNGVEVAIWDNSTRDKDILSITVKSSYKDGDAWKDSDSFAHWQIPTLSTMILLSQHWIAEELDRRKPTRR